VAESKLGIVITARDESSRNVKAAAAALEKFGVDAKKAGELAKQGLYAGADVKGLKNIEASFKRLGLSTEQARAKMKEAGIDVSALGEKAEQASTGVKKIGLTSAEARVMLKHAGAEVKTVARHADEAKVSTTSFSSVLSRVGQSAGSVGRGLSSATASITRLGSSIQSAGQRLTTFVGVGLAGLAGGIGILSKLGMDSVETANLYKVSMGGMEVAGTRWVKAMNEAYGLNTRALQQNLGMFQSWFTSMGFGEKTAYGMSTALSQLSYDFSSFFNVAPEEAFTKIQSAMAGETEAVRRWGIDVSDAAVKAYALKNGLSAQGDELSQAQKAWVRYRLILDQSKNAQGDLGRTMQSPANMLRLLKERATAFATEIGQKMMPVVSSALVWMNDEGFPRVKQAVKALEDGWVNMSDTAKRRVIAVATLLVAGGPLLQAVGIGVKAIGFIGTAFVNVGKVALSRVGLIAGAVVALGAVVYETLEGIGNATAEVGRGLTSFAGFIDSLPSASDEWTKERSARMEAIRAEGQAMINAGESMAKFRRDNGGLADIARLTDDALNGTADAARDFNDVGTAGVKTTSVLGQTMIRLAGYAKDPVGAFDDLSAAVEKLGAVNVAEWAKGFDEAIGYAPKIKSDAEYMKEAAKNYQEGLAQYQPPEISQEDWDNLDDDLDDAKKKAKDAGISVGDLTQALVANSAITRTAAVAVTYWESQIEATNLAIEANRDQLQAAQSELSRMQDHLSELNDELTIAKQKFDEFSHPTLSGMGAFADQIFEAEQAIKRLQLAELNWQIAGGVGDSPFKAEIEAAQRELQRLQLEQSLTFDPQMRALEQMANPQTEMTYEQAAQGIKEWGARVAELTKAVEVQEKAIKSQEEVVKSIQAAADALNRTLAYQQEQLQLARTNFENVTKALTAAFTWFLTDREEIAKMGPEGAKAAGLVDEETKNLLLALTGFTADNTAQSQKNIAQMVADYEAAVAKIKAMLNGIGGPGVPSIGAATGSSGGYRAVVDGKVVYDGPSQNAAENAFNAAGGGAFGPGNLVEKHDYPGPAYAGRTYKIGTEEYFTPFADGYIAPIGGASAPGGAASPTIVHVHVAGSVVSEGDLVEAVHAGLLRKRARSGSLGLS
jgi:hypothetical protein